MNENNQQTKAKEKEGYFCFDDTPEDLSDYLVYLKEKISKQEKEESNTMEYLEDYLSEELIDALDAEFKKIYDNEEFCLCTLSELKNDDEALKLLNYLKTHTITKSTRYEVTLFQMRMEKERLL